jgi:hypothetical protein
VNCFWSQDWQICLDKIVAVNDSVRIVTHGLEVVGVDKFVTGFAMENDRSEKQKILGIKKATFAEWLFCF